jgi:hypothetical protein
MLARATGAWEAAKELVHAPKGRSIFTEFPTFLSSLFTEVPGW